MRVIKLQAFNNIFEDWIEGLYLPEGPDHFRVYNTDLSALRKRMSEALVDLPDEPASIEGIPGTRLERLERLERIEQKLDKILIHTKANGIINT